MVIDLRRLEKRLIKYHQMQNILNGGWKGLSGLTILGLLVPLVEMSSYVIGLQ